MNDTIKLLLSLSLSGSILTAFIFAIKPLIKNKLSKSIQYYIWIIVLLRLITPFSFENNIMNNMFYTDNITTELNNKVDVQSIEKIGDSAIDSQVLTNVQNNVTVEDYDNYADQNGYFIDIFNKYVVYIWMLGMIIALSINLTGYLRFLHYLKEGYRPAADEENRVLLLLLNGKGHVKLMRNKLVNTPMLVGILNPRIIIPDIDFNEKQTRSILLHEISHLRHFDIWVKWLTLAVCSIHWFNPIMHFIKKEINHACELTCDEIVIKNLSQTEKQAYGDTLISVVAEQKYPVGILQATMCEEKNSLKERLIAIMNYNKKSKFIMLLSVMLLGLIVFGALYLGAVVEIEKDTPPNIYIASEMEKTKTALIGSYSWENKGKYIQADSDDPINFEYELDNIISAGGKEQLIISTQKLKKDRQYDFTIEGIAVYKDNQLIELETSEPIFMNGDLYIQGPQDVGEYIYVLVLNFKDKGTVSYGFVVRVDMLTYDLAEISKYKTPYVGDSSKVSAIARNLPVPQNYFKQQYISMQTSDEPYSLTIYYEPSSNIEYDSDWPIIKLDSVIETNSRTNALVIFCMIENVNEVTFAFRDSQSDGELDELKYNTTFAFSRASFVEKYGDLSVLGENLDLLEDALMGKTSVKELETNSQFSMEIIDLVENNLKIIMSSPKESSNPMDYTNAHQKEYENIIISGNEKALEYMLSQFKDDNAEGLRGQLMMNLCKEILGERNNATDESLSPMEWFTQLNI